MDEAMVAVLEDGNAMVRDSQRIQDRLLEIMKPDAAKRWMYAPLAALGERSPHEAMESGETERVLELIAAVAHGVHT